MNTSEKKTACCTSESVNRHQALNQNGEKVVKIAVSGKGGVGKTTVAGTLANFFAENGFKVLAIDADSAPNLALTLGISSYQASKIIPISENSDLIEKKTGTGMEGVYRLYFTVDDIVRDFCVKSPRVVNLLVMGTIRSAGSGCMCSANALVRALLRHLLVERDEVVIMDMEAGVEHMGRGTARHMDAMFIVTDSSLKSLEIGKKLHNLAKEAGIEKAFFVGNKVKNSDEGRLIEEFAANNGIALLELIPYDEEILKADMQGKMPFNYAEISKGISTIQRIGEKLIQQDINS